MRKFTLLLLCSFYVFQGFGQDQLRFKAGVSRAFPTGNNSGLLHSAHQYKSFLPSQFGLEYFHPLRENKAGIFTGILFEAHGYAGSINLSKFESAGAHAPYRLGGQYGSIKLYAGFEKMLTKTDRLNANTFSVFGGAGLAVNAIGMGNAGGLIQDFSGTTLNGDTYQSRYLREDDKSLGRSFQIRARRANLFTPELFGGIRYNVNNRRGETVLTLEGVVNYSPLPKAYIEFPYILNGAPMVDRISDHGFNVQFNALVPIKMFRVK